VTLHVTVQHVEQGVIMVDADGVTGVRIKPNPALTDVGNLQIMFVDRVVTTREVTHRAIFSYTDPEGVRQQFESDVPGLYKFGGPRGDGIGQTYRVLYDE
jgi:hypothetical protein